MSVCLVVGQAEAAGVAGQMAVVGQAEAAGVAGQMAVVGQAEAAGLVEQIVEDAKEDCLNIQC